MPLLKKTLAFTAPGSATTKTLTIGFRAKLVLFYATGRLSAGASPSFADVLGYAISTTRAEQFAVAGTAIDGTNPHDVTRRTSGTPSDYCIVQLSMSGGAQTRVQEAYLSAIRDTEIDVTFDTSDQERQLLAVCYGGDEVIAEQNQWQSRTTVGPTTHAGWGGEPETLIALTALDTAKGGTDLVATGSFGFSDGAASYCGGWGMQDAVGGAAEGGLYQRLLAVPFNGTDVMEIDVTSLDANGYTLSNPTPNASARWCGVVGLRGLLAEVVTDTQPLTDGTKATTTTIAGESLIAISAGKTTFGRGTDANISIGAQVGTGVESVGGIYFGADNGGVANVSRLNSINRVINNLTNNGSTPSVVGEANVESWGSTSLTLRWRLTNGTAYDWAGLVLATEWSPAIRGHITRHGMHGGPRPPYGTFDPKAAAPPGGSPVDPKDVSRHGLHGGPRPPYGAFAPKAESGGGGPVGAKVVSRHGLYGGPRSPYAAFAPKGPGAPVGPKVVSRRGLHGGPRSPYAVFWPKTPNYGGAPGVPWRRSGGGGLPSFGDSLDHLNTEDRNALLVAIASSYYYYVEGA